MYNPNNESPISPMKKLRILSEKQQNVQEINEQPTLETIKEAIVNNTQPEVAAAETDKEPLLEENPNKYVIFPIAHDDMWQMYKHLVDNFWSPTETLQSFDSLNLNYNELQFMKYFSSIFSSPHLSRGLVNDNFAEEFCKLIQVTEAKFFYGHQLFVQNIHCEMYNKLFENFVLTQEERAKYSKIVEAFDAVQEKSEWVAQWTHSSFGEQLAASACLHGLLFTGLELLNDWLKSRTKNMFHHELVDFLDRMILDQELQRDFDCLMISHLKSKPEKEKTLNMVNQAAKIEFNFLLNGLKTELINIEPEELILLIDRKTKDLKVKLFATGGQRKQIQNVQSTNDMKRVASSNGGANGMADQEARALQKENSQKFVLDEDF
jgi:ribonucleotide reductase beta subunit family protein with ferritin-like domain